ncbi:MAG: hypothetical protein PHO02_05005 [Candidatus Nanoarchaeia archaeon]|nr:hypothetical protein [Candidatus Nanoarchaeia archaeon]
MTDIKVINEIPLTMAELKEKLAKIEKRDKELAFRANKTKEYLNNFTIKEKGIAALKKKIAELNISRLKDRHIAKLIDIAPKDIDSIKCTLSGEALTLKEEDYQKLLEALQE